MAEIEEKSTDTDCETRGKTLFMKVEMKSQRRRHTFVFPGRGIRQDTNAISEKMKNSVSETSKGASRDLRMCPFLNWKE